MAMAKRYDRANEERSGGAIEALDAAGKTGQCGDVGGGPVEADRASGPIRDPTVTYHSPFASDDLITFSHPRPPQCAHANRYQGEPSKKNSYLLFI